MNSFFVVVTSLFYIYEVIFHCHPRSLFARFLFFRELRFPYTMNRVGFRALLKKRSMNILEPPRLIKPRRGHELFFWKSPIPKWPHKLAPTRKERNKQENKTKIERGTITNRLLSTFFSPVSFIVAKKQRSRFYLCFSFLFFCHSDVPDAEEAGDAKKGWGGDRERTLIDE